MRLWLALRLRLRRVLIRFLELLEKARRRPFALSFVLALLLMLTLFVLGARGQAADAEQARQWDAEQEKRSVQAEKARQQAEKARQQAEKASRKPLLAPVDAMLAAACRVTRVENGPVLRKTCSFCQTSMEWIDMGDDAVSVLVDAALKQRGLDRASIRRGAETCQDDAELKAIALAAAERSEAARKAERAAAERSEAARKAIALAAAERSEAARKAERAAEHAALIATLRANEAVLTMLLAACRVTRVENGIVFRKTCSFCKADLELVDVKNETQRAALELVLSGTGLDRESLSRGAETCRDELRPSLP